MDAKQSAPSTTGARTHVDQEVKAAGGAQDAVMAGLKQERDAEGEEGMEEEKSHTARHGDITTDDDPQESTADEDDSEEEDDEDENGNAGDKASVKDQAGISTKPKATPKPATVDLSDSESMLRMMRSLPEREARRHEQFRRSHFERSAIKRSMAQAIQECSATDKKIPGVTNVMAIVMAGMTKVFVGEITAEARRIMEKAGETGPIRPRHLREAHRKYYKRRPLARGRNTRRLLR